MERRVAMMSRASRAFADFTGVPDDDLISGRLGVFASEWVDAKQEPKRTANFMVVVRGYEPVIALFIKGLGWDLADTMHTGLESEINMWMELPKPQENR
jgi:hypothetical protein